MLSQVYACKDALPTQSYTRANIYFNSSYHPKTLGIENVPVYLKRQQRDFWENSYLGHNTHLCMSDWYTQYLGVQHHTFLIIPHSLQKSYVEVTCTLITDTLHYDQSKFELLCQYEKIRNFGTYHLTRWRTVQLRSIPPYILVGTLRFPLENKVHSPQFLRCPQQHGYNEKVHLPFSASREKHRRRAH